MFAVVVAAAAFAFMLAAATAVQIFLRGGTFGDQFHVKRQVNAGQRMIGVNAHFLFRDVHHGCDGGLVVVAKSELVADFNLTGWKLFSRHIQNPIWIEHAVGILGGHGQTLLITGLELEELRFKAGDDVPSAGHKC